MRPVHVLIAGGSGMIGSDLVPALLNRNYLVTVVSRYPWLFGRDNPALRCIDYTRLIDLQEPVSIVINLAGQRLDAARWSAGFKQQLVDSRVNTTEILYQFTKNVTGEAPKLVICSSAIGFYGHRQRQYCNEHTAGGNGFAADLCQRWEDAACYFQRLDTRLCILRFGVVLKAEDGALFRMLLPFKCGLGGKLGRGTQGFSWIHGVDLVRAILYMIDHQTLSGVFNVTAPEPVSNGDFTQALGRVLHRPTWVTMPELVCRIVFGEMAEQLLLNGQYVIPEALLSAGYDFEFPDIDSALTDLLVH